jgi:hypothetical protein
MHITKLPPLVMGRREGPCEFLRGDGRTWTTDYAEAAEFAEWFARGVEQFEAEWHPTSRLPAVERLSGYSVRAFA